MEKRHRISSMTLIEPAATDLELQLLKEFKNELVKKRIEELAKNITYNLSRKALRDSGYHCYHKIDCSDWICDCGSVSSNASPIMGCKKGLL
jgi:hypothetical protein